MELKAAIVSAVLVLACPSFAAAGPVADAAGRAEALQAEGKTVEALDALNEAVAAVWDSTPLAFRKVVLVESAGGLGTYTERSARTFRPDEKLRVYVEPVGFGYAGQGSASTIGFTTSLAIENTTGQVLSEEQDLFSISAESARNRREFGMTLAFGVPYLRPGDYTARFTVADQNSDKTGTFDVPFTVVAPGAGAAAEANSTSTSTSAQSAPEAAPAQ